MDLDEEEGKDLYQEIMGYGKALIPELIYLGWIGNGSMSRHGRRVPPACSTGCAPGRPQNWMGWQAGARSRGAAVAGKLDWKDWRVREHFTHFVLWNILEDGNNSGQRSPNILDHEVVGKTMHILDGINEYRNRIMPNCICIWEIRCAPSDDIHRR